MTGNTPKPPHIRATSPAERPRRPDAAQPPQSPPPPKPPLNPMPNDRAPSRWVLWGTVLAGLVVVSLIPVPNYVSGKTTITSRPEQRDRLVMPRSGIVAIDVVQNEVVARGDRLATITSPDLDRAIAEAERGLQQARGALSRAQENLFIAETRWQASQTETELASDRRQDRQADLTELETGEGLPRSRQIQQEQAGLGAEIAELKSEQFAVRQELAAQREDMEGVHRQWANIQERIEIRNNLVEKGAFPRDAVVELEYQALQLEREMQSIRNQREIRSNRLYQLQSQIRQRQRSIAALGEQTEEVKRQTKLELKDETQDYVLTRERSQTSRREVDAAATETRYQARLVKEWEDELLRLRDEKDKLELTAKTSGTVTTEDLDLLNGKRLEAGEVVLELADLQQLTATVQVRQEDYFLLKKGQQANFKSDQGEQEDAQVNDMSPTIQVETQGAAPMARVEILIDNERELLLPGGEGYTHIRTQNRPIYRKVLHELDKLLNLDRLIPFA
ncbi:MAG: HlyD family efflux transporter periplasmic adaptor subunit [Spirulinaceae cyanobacterium]